MVRRPTFAKLVDPVAGQRNLVLEFDILYGP
jgi:hypothetical protein